MKVKRIQFNRYGGASEMYIGDYDLPQLKADEVLIKVKAAAINPLDWKQRAGAMKLFMNRRFPKGIGNDFAGIVEAVGTNVAHLETGDEVFGTMKVTKPGAFSELLITSAVQVTKMPSNISFSEAACLPIPCMVAWAGLFVKGNIAHHSSVMVNGCMGAVGSMAVQLAKAKGAYVAGTCSKKELPEAQRYNLDKIFDYSEERYWAQTVPFDLVFDTPGLMNIKDGFAMLKKSGTFIDINPTPKRLLQGITSKKYKMTFATTGLTYLSEIAALAAQGKLKVNIAKEIGFTETIENIIKIEKGERVKGRIVIKF